MVLNLKLQLRQNQQLIMTPQLQQAIRLLQLSRLELESLVDQALVENPVLEEVEEGSDDASGEVELTVADSGGDLIENDHHEEIDRDWQEYIESGSGVIPERSSGKEGDDSHLEATLCQTESLQEHLLWQLKMVSWSKAERALGKQLIGNLDEDGYLVLSLGEILEKDASLRGLLEKDLQSDELALSREGLSTKLFWAKHEGNMSESKGLGSIEEEMALAAEAVLSQVQQWDPVGCGARYLQECLEVQLRVMELGDGLAMRIVQQDLKLLERRDLKKINRRYKVTLEKVVKAWQLITSLEPKPGRPFVESRAQNIIPDVYLFHSMGNSSHSENTVGDYRITLNESGIPNLRISEHYRLLSEKADSSNGSLTRQYIQEKIKAGQWLMRSIEQRQKTILKVARSILKHQYDFFEKGVDQLKPLVLKDVAEDIGVHESTVSRITTNKYMHTPQGLFELKYFFTSGVGQDHGEAISSKKIKDMILKLVNKENPLHPYTDIQIADTLYQVSGVKVARRTVAKYREALNILPSNRRKKLF